MKKKKKLKTYLNHSSQEGLCWSVFNKQNDAPWVLWATKASSDSSNLGNTGCLLCIMKTWYLWEYTDKLKAPYYTSVRAYGNAGWVSSHLGTKTLKLILDYFLLINAVCHLHTGSRNQPVPRVKHRIDPMWQCHSAKNTTDSKPPLLMHLPVANTIAETPRQRSCIVFRLAASHRQMAHRCYATPQTHKPQILPQ